MLSVCLFQSIQSTLFFLHSSHTERERDRERDREGERERREREGERREEQEKDGDLLQQTFLLRTTWLHIGRRFNLVYSIYIEYFFQY